MRHYDASGLKIRLTVLAGSSCPDTRIVEGLDLTYKQSGDEWSEYCPLESGISRAS